ncbi:MAG: murein biosynthesis integral membrane protein MurJ [Kiritimatiellae bacterium]|jgi:putative peptidoglycan lipid II flippase|nr:murein biosynthesis integral membrane protein MurJ [Kiritimatiellia bacterium]
MKTNLRIFRSAGAVSLGTISSRVLGLLREMLMAWTFGTDKIASAFVVAFTIPNLFRRLFGEGALSAAFIPSYVRVREEKGPLSAWQLTRNTVSLLILILGGISFAGMLLCCIALRWRGLPENLVPILSSLRILLPYMIWICLAALMMGVLNSHRKYVVPAFIPCILNACWIAALLVVNRYTAFSDDLKIEVICWVILAAGVLQFALQLPSVWKLGYRKPEKVDPLGPEVKKVLTLMAPAALGAAVVQLNVLCDRLLALWVGGYGPISLSYAERLIYLPLGIFATALGTILLPEFSNLVQQKDREQLGEVLDRSLRVLMYVMIPAAVGLAVLAVPIVAFIFQRGAFDALSTTLTSRALAFYAPGLIVFGSAKIFVPLFYAHGDTRTPVRIGVWTVLMNLGLNLLFIVSFPDGWKHAGLALGTVLSSLLQVVALAGVCQKRYAHIHWLPVLRSWGRCVLASIPMILAAQWTLREMSTQAIGFRVPAAILVAGGVYALTTLALRCPEIRELRRH